MSLIKDAFLKDKHNDAINNCYNGTRRHPCNKGGGGLSLFRLSTEYYNKFDCRLADELKKVNLVSVEHLVSQLSDSKRHLLELHYDDKGNLIMSPTPATRKRFAKEEEDERERNQRPIHPNLVKLIIRTFILWHVIKM